MSLYRRGDIWHFDFTRDGHRHRGSTGLRGKKAAREFEDRERARAALGSSRGASAALEDVSAQWFVEKVAGTKSEATVGFRLDVVLRLLGPRTLITEIKSLQMADAIAARRMEPTRQTRKSAIKRVPSNATINRDLIDTTMRPMMRWARKRLELPVADIDWKELRLPEGPARNRSFSQEEQDAFLMNLPSWHHQLLGFYKRYGWRLREAFVPLAAVDLDLGRITLRKRKRGPDHYTPLLEEDRAVLAALIGRARAAGLDTPWFREMPDGTLKPIHWRAFQSACAKAVKDAELIDARPVHDWRHHAGTAILRSTGNLQVARKLLGHEDIKSTARYAHAYDDDVLQGLRHASGTKSARPKKKVI